jgi:putative redox protein
VSQLKTCSELSVNVKKEDSERRKLRETKIGTQRIDVEWVEQLRFKASFGHFAFTIDEPPERGGTNAGLPPLAYFLAGAASCLMTQYVKLAISSRIPITSIKTIVRGHFDKQVGGAFKDMIYEMAIESPASEDGIRGIAREAELMCYAHNTLKESVHMQTNLTLNGKHLEF